MVIETGAKSALGALDGAANRLVVPTCRAAPAATAAVEIIEGSVSFVLAEQHENITAVKGSGLSPHPVVEQAQHREATHDLADLASRFCGFGRIDVEDNGPIKLLGRRHGRTSVEPSEAKRICHPSPRAVVDVGVGHDDHACVRLVDGALRNVLRRSWIRSVVGATRSDCQRESTDRSGKSATCDAS